MPALGTGAQRRGREDRPVSDAIKLSGVGVDCPNAGELAAFYAEITGGTVTHVTEH